MGINGISSGCYPEEYGNKILQDIKNTDNPVMKAISDSAVAGRSGR